MMMNLKKRSSSHVEHILKALFALSWCRIAEDDSSEDMLSWSPMHVDDRDEVVVAQQWRRRKPRCVVGLVGLVASSVTAAHIYRGESPRITASHNRLSLYQNALDM
jgi:hypothetical protein